jgi:hypothetical protein
MTRPPIVVLILMKLGAGRARRQRDYGMAAKRPRGAEKHGAMIRPNRPHETGPALRCAGASHAPVFMDK